MAIKLTRTVQRVECYPAHQGVDTDEKTYPTLMVVYNETFDDPKDNDLPVVATKVKNLTKGDDIENEDQLVKDIAESVWK